MIRSGWGASARNTPGLPLRFFAARRSARLGLRACEGGVEELSGVLGGPPSLASSSAMRRVNSSICAAWASICAAWASTSSISSSDDRFESASRYILRLNQANIHLSSQIYAPRSPSPQNLTPPPGSVVSRLSRTAPLRRSRRGGYMKSRGNAPKVGTRRVFDLFARPPLARRLPASPKPRRADRDCDASLGRANRDAQIGGSEQLRNGSRSRGARPFPDAGRSGYALSATPTPPDASPRPRRNRRRSDPGSRAWP